MSDERLILCGDLVPPSGTQEKDIVPLRLWGTKSNVALKISDISKKMVANIPEVLVDLLEIATYVYCADQATTRGGKSDPQFGAKWRRHFRFLIPVRKPEIWKSEPVITALRDTLGFLSDDDYEFDFRRLQNPPSVEEYIEFGPVEASGFRPDEVILFSGGMDSLGGAVQEAVLDKRNVALVSHRSSPKISKRMRCLVEDLKEPCSSRFLHIPVWANKDKYLGREYTQRSRSFLFASLAAVVARLFDLSRIRFYENGIVSINLPLSPQAVGGRASRTTHPQVLNGFSDIFSAVFQRQFIVENPFIWKTKSDVVQTIREAGCGDLIKHTASCTHVWNQTKLHTHCGVCSQCLDRRFATLAAGCTDVEDPEEMYAVDLLKGSREPGESRTMAESYVRTARKIMKLSDVGFFSEFGEVHRVTRHIKGLRVDDAASRIVDLYKRHATYVSGVITKGVQECADDIANGRVPDSCLLILALPDKYKRPPAFQEPVVNPVLILDDIHDGTANQTLLARIVGTRQFDGVNKKIGSRELFFTYLLFKSTRIHDFSGERLTVITEDEAVMELLKWSEEGYLKVSGKDRDNPVSRVRKMWGEFVKQMKKDNNFEGLFSDHHKDKDRRKLYSLRLRPDEKQILVASIPALFRKTGSAASRTPIRV